MGNILFDPNSPEVKYLSGTKTLPYRNSCIGKIIDMLTQGEKNKRMIVKEIQQIQKEEEKMNAKKNKKNKNNDANDKMPNVDVSITIEYLTKQFKDDIIRFFNDPLSMSEEDKKKFDLLKQVLGEQACEVYKRKVLVSTSKFDPRPIEEYYSKFQKPMLGEVTMDNVTYPVYEESGDSITFGSSELQGAEIYLKNGKKQSVYVKDGKIIYYYEDGETKFLSHNCKAMGNIDLGLPLYLVGTNYIGEIFLSNTKPE